MTERTREEWNERRAVFPTGDALEPSATVRQKDLGGEDDTGLGSCILAMIQVYANEVF